MPSTVVTHLLNAAGNRLCCVHDGPTTPLTSLFKDTCAAGVTFCPDCIRAALAPIVELAQSRCGADPLLDTILVLMVTPPDLAALVLRTICSAIVELDAYVEQVGGHFD